MKKKVLITILIIFILLICSMIGVWIIISPKDDVTTLAKENVINPNTIVEDTTIENTISNEVEPEPTATVPETEIIAEEPKQDEVTVEKTTTSTTTTSKNTSSTGTSTKNNKTDNTQNSKDTSSKSTSSSTSVQTTTQTTTKPVEQTTQTQTQTQTPTQPTRCTNNNNHGMDVGNSGKWFNSKSEAIAFYEEKINYWDEWWKKADPNDTNADATYYKNCPKGYEIWSCMYCGKWTINLYYR